MRIKYKGACQERLRTNYGRSFLSVHLREAIFYETTSVGSMHNYVVSGIEKVGSWEVTCTLVL